MSKQYKSVIVIFDSLFGNTQKIAKAITTAFKTTSKVRLAHVSEVGSDDLKPHDLVIVGSPTQGGRPTVTLSTFLESLPSGSLKGKDIAAFDTRFDENKQKFSLKMLMKFIGYAAPKIQAVLVSKGGNPISKPQAFIVNGKEGPLKSGEAEKATAIWLKSLKVI